MTLGTTNSLKNFLLRNNFDRPIGGRQFSSHPISAVVTSALTDAGANSDSSRACARERCRATCHYLSRGQSSGSRMRVKVLLSSLESCVVKWPSDSTRMSDVSRKVFPYAIRATECFHEYSCA